MKYEISLEGPIIKNAFTAVFSRDKRKRGNFFHELRQALKNEIENLLIEKGISINTNNTLENTNLLKGKIIPFNPIKIENEELDYTFCAKYGHKDYSLEAINWYTDYVHFPSLLPFVKVKNFSIGNIAILVRNDDYEIKVRSSGPVQLVGYSQNISSKNRKSYICFLGIRFDHNYLSSILNKFFVDCRCSPYDLDHIFISNISYPTIFICKKCGKLFICNCFENYVNFKDDLIRYTPGGLLNKDKNNLVRNYIQQIEYRDNICHLCTNSIPNPYYHSDLYPSSFLQYFLPYFRLLSLKKYKTPFPEKEEAKEVENDLRETFGYAKIGKKWLSETTLFKIVETLFPTTTVIHHYRGKELGSLELDIWLPELRLGIEYQGEQHYMPVEHWGGEEGLKKRIANDRKKKKLCKSLNYHLIEFKYSEDLSVENVEHKLLRFLKLDFS